MHAFTTLNQWLEYIESIHSQEIDLGLDRIQQVAKRLAIDLSFAKVITVAGTNGKGTTCAFIEHALMHLGQRVAVYSSPHIHQFNERLRLNNESVEDSALIAAFAKVEQARSEISLSYYEFTTLACLLHLMQVKPAFILLEVGLGGRLDATNMIDTDIAVITSVDIDHQAFLGDTREAIGYEKAGIMRANKPVVLGELEPPESVLNFAQQCQAIVYQQGRDYVIEQSQDNWQWQNNQGQHYQALPLPHIPLMNAATALAVLTQLELTFTEPDVQRWCEQVKLEGRLERVKHQGKQLMFDVGHNPHAARLLADYIKQQLQTGAVQRIFAIVAMMKDKDISQSIAPFDGFVTAWYCPNLTIERAAKGEQTAQVIKRTLAEQHVAHFDNAKLAYKMAQQQASDNDLILIFGSFFTVAEVKHVLAEQV